MSSEAVQPGTEPGDPVPGGTVGDTVTADDMVTAGEMGTGEDLAPAGETATAVAAVSAAGGSQQQAGAAGSFPEGAAPYDVDSLLSGPIELPQEVAAATGSGWFSSGPARPDVAQALCTDRDVRRINLGALQPVAAVHPYPLLFSCVAGSHLYGYPSRDSDVDLRGLHLLPPVQVVGLRRGPQTVERTWLHDEVPLDLVTHDAGKFFRLLLRHNGYVLEQLLSPLVVTTGPVHEELVALASLCLTRRHAEHYRTAAQNQWELFTQTGEAKHVLAAFRILLTGIQLVRGGQLVTHLPTLLETVPSAPAYLAELVEAKAEDEHLGADGLPERVDEDVVTLQAELDTAEGESPLPDHPGAEGVLHDLLVRLRLEGIPTRLS